MKLSCHPSSIMCRYFSKQRWQWLAGILAAWWILRREVWIRLNKKKQKNRLCPVYCWNWHCENNPWQCLWFAIISFSSPTKIIDQSTTVSLLYHHFKCWGDPMQSLLTGSTVPTTHSPVTSHQIWFVWRYSWCFIYFCPVRHPAGTLWVSWFIRTEQKNDGVKKKKKKRRQPLSLHLLALMKFNEMKFSTTSIGVGRIILKCFITAVVLACGISSFGTWRASFITIR